MYRQGKLSNLRKKSKYNNVSRHYNGRTYDSILEAKVAQELDWRMKAGEIAEIIPQYKISLDVNGKHICNYYCDFKVIKPDGSVEFVEAKGFETEVYRLKKKLLEAMIDQIEPGAEYIVIK
jgi:hypothetical protein